MLFRSKTRKPRKAVAPPRAVSDNLCKLLAERHPEQFAEWLFGPLSGPVKVLKTELSREPLRADAAIFLESTADIFHIEFQTTSQSHVPLPVRNTSRYGSDGVPSLSTKLMNLPPFSHTA